jgi:hypothetical protein
MSGITSDCAELSEVGIGIAPVGVGSPVSIVPKAVVIPTTIPEVGCKIESTEGNTETLVGRIFESDGSTPVGRGSSPVKPDGTVTGREGMRPVAVGICPVDPMGRSREREGMISVGVGSTPVEPNGKSNDRVGKMPDGVATSEEASDGPRDTDGWTLEAGRLSVEDGIMNGPRIVVPAVDEGCSFAGAGALGDTIDSGTPPVDAVPDGTIGIEAAGADVAGSDGKTPVAPTKIESVGRTMDDGKTPVGPMTGKSVGRTTEDGRTPVEPTIGKSVGNTIGEGRTPVEPASGTLEGRTIEEGSPPVDPMTGISGSWNLSLVAAAGEDEG